MIKKRRIELGLSRAQLAHRTGVPQRFIAEFEVGGGAAHQREKALVTAFLRLPTVRISEQFCGPEENLASWQAAERSCLDYGLPLPCEEFCARVPCTLLQALAWCRLLKDGAEVAEASPVEFGFWKHGLMDQYHSPLGITPLPCISWQNSSWRYVLWPQLRLRAEQRTYRLDGLALAAGWGNSRWTGLQLDGDQNRWDTGLRSQLKLPFLTLDTTEVHTPGWRPRLESLLLPGSELRLIDGQNSLREILCGPSRPGRNFEAGLLQLAK